MTSDTLPSANKKLVKRLVFTVVAMFGFGYALVPLYDILCEVTGFTGRTGVVAAENVGELNSDRLVKVEFMGSTNSDLSWEFRPLIKSMEVHPGGIYEVKYFARNTGLVKTVGQARPSVSPTKASLYFSKTECFCFTNQSFEAGEGREMPVRFVVDDKLPGEISTLTLSYQFFKVDSSG
jgi:cytochrome c oxidase assembly protein subunit 11